MLFTGFLTARVGVHHPSLPVWKGGLAGNPRLLAVVVGSILLQFFILHIPALQRLFGITSTSIWNCLALLSLASVPLFVLEIVKSRASPLRSSSAPVA